MNTAVAFIWDAEDKSVSVRLVKIESVGSIRVEMARGPKG